MEESTDIRETKFTGIWAVILAAGESRRMGFPKMLLKFNGKTMLRNVIDSVTGSLIRNVIVVLGCHRYKLTDIVEDAGVTYCINENYKKGMLSSVICGLRNLPVDFKAAMIFQGDQPFIHPGVINKVAEAWLASEKGIAVPVYNGKRGHPLMIDARYKTDIEELSYDKGLRSLLGKYPDDVIEIETDQSGILRDFDTYEEYKMEINK